MVFAPLESVEAQAEYSTFDPVSHGELLFSSHLLSSPLLPLLPPLPSPLISSCLRVLVSQMLMAMAT